jgi:hypothetical protein
MNIFLIWNIFEEEKMKTRENKRMVTLISISFQICLF